MANKLIVHGVGGCGINVTNDVFNSVSNLGDGFCEVIRHYVDTSTANIGKVKEGSKWLIKSKDVTKAAIKGSGGERKTHHLDIMSSIKEYVTQGGWTSKKPNEFHFVVFSGSGGTGSVGGVILTQSLLTRDIPTVVFLVGDSTNALNTKNTMDTIASLDKIARASKKPLSVVYYNNHEVANEKGLSKAEQFVNSSILNMASVLSMFLSGTIDDIDEQDMYGLIDQSHYRKITVEPGLYKLEISLKDLKTLSNATPTVNRTLTVGDIEYDIDTTFLHSKRGYVVVNNAIDRIKQDNFPVHLTSYANYFTTEHERLSSLEKEYNNIMSSIRNNAVGGASDAVEDDDTGLVL